MTWKTIIAGVDDSPEGAWAGGFAWDLAQDIGARCELVHITVDLSNIPVTPEADVDLDELVEQMTKGAREAVEQRLRGSVPQTAIGQLDVVMGKSGWMLAREVRRRQGDLLVLGGKHHTGLDRWLGGSVAHYAARTVDVPTLITIPPIKRPGQILAGVDLTDAAVRTVEVAQEMASIFDASLRVVHAIEPPPTTYPIQLPDWDPLREYSEERFHEMLDAIDGNESIARVIRYGRAETVLAEEAAEWRAGLIVVGSHRGFVDRFLLGSTTQRLLYRLPASLLVVPSGVRDDGTSAATAQSVAATGPPV